jgi:hypothetical protein
VVEDYASDRTIVLPAPPTATSQDGNRVYIIYARDKDAHSLKTILRGALIALVISVLSSYVIAAITEWREARRLRREAEAEANQIRLGGGGGGGGSPAKSLLEQLDDAQRASDTAATTAADDTAQ